MKRTNNIPDLFYSNYRMRYEIIISQEPTAEVNLNNESAPTSTTNVIAKQKGQTTFPIYFNQINYLIR